MDKKSKKKGTVKKTRPTPAPDVLTKFVCVIDRSGSMERIANDAIGGFNAFLKDQQGMDGKADLTMVLFDNEFVDLYKSTPIADVKPLDRKSYVPRGTTALYDAIGRAITSVREICEKPGAEPTRVMVVILTDGMENSSHEYSKATITDMIKNCQDNLKWAFLYLSASPSAFSDGGGIGLGAQTISFGHNAAGASAATAVYGCATQDFRMRGTIGCAQSYARAADPSGKNLKVDGKYT